MSVDEKWCANDVEDLFIYFFYGIMIMLKLTCLAAEIV